MGYILIGYFFSKQWKVLKDWLDPAAPYLILARIDLVILDVIFRHFLSGLLTSLFQKEPKLSFKNHSVEGLNCRPYFLHSRGFERNRIGQRADIFDFNCHAIAGFQPAWWLVCHANAERCAGQNHRAWKQRRRAA